MSKRQDVDKVLTTEALENLVLLRQTREMITRYGWSTDAYMSQGGVCLMGAALLASGFSEVQVLEFDLDVEIENLMDHAAVLLGFGSSCRAIDWNDEVAESQEQVLCKIDEAIEKVVA